MPEQSPAGRQRPRVDVLAALAATAALLAALGVRLPRALSELLVSLGNR